MELELELKLKWWQVDWVSVCVQNVLMVRTVLAVSWHVNAPPTRHIVITWQAPVPVALDIKASSVRDLVTQDAMDLRVVTSVCVKMAQDVTTWPEVVRVPLDGWDPDVAILVHQERGDPDVTRCVTILYYSSHTNEWWWCLACILGVWQVKCVMWNDLCVFICC